MDAKFQKDMERRYEKDLDVLIYMVTAKEESDLFSREKGTLLYSLESEEIDLKNLEARA